MFYKGLTVVIENVYTRKTLVFFVCGWWICEKSWYFLIVFCWGSVDFSLLYFWVFWEVLYKYIRSG